MLTTWADHTTTDGTAMLAIIVAFDSTKHHEKHLSVDRRCLRQPMLSSSHARLNVALNPRGRVLFMHAQTHLQILQGDRLTETDVPDRGRSSCLSQTCKQPSRILRAATCSSRAPRWTSLLPPRGILFRETAALRCTRRHPRPLRPVHAGGSTRRFLRPGPNARGMPERRRTRARPPLGRAPAVSLDRQQPAAVVLLDEEALPNAASPTAAPPA